MGCYKFLILAVSSVLFSLPLNLISAQTHVCDFCKINSGANYTANSTFQANLNLLLSSISNTTNQFYTNAVGLTPNRVYSLFQCRGDCNSQDCHKCAQTASEAIKINCPYKKKAIVVYDECWLHYSGEFFVSTVQLDPTVYLLNTNSVRDPRFTQSLNELMDRLVVQAVSNASSLFAAGETNFTTSQKLYGLVQCSCDLNARDCNRCLRRSVSQFPNCCDKKKGGRVIKPSCNARYETYEFFESQEIASAPAPPPGVITQPSTNNKTRQGKISSKNILVIVVPTIIGALALSRVVIFCHLRRNDRQEVVNGKLHVESFTLFREQVSMIPAVSSSLW